MPVATQGNMMRFRIGFIVAMAGVVALVSGCQMDRKLAQFVGTAGGAGGGAGLCKALDAKMAVTALCGLAGGVAGYFIATALTQEEMVAVTDKTIDVLDKNPNSVSSSSATMPNSQVGVTIQAKPSYKVASAGVLQSSEVSPEVRRQLGNSANLTCRQATRTYSKQGSKEAEQILYCRDPNGDWLPVESRKVSVV